METASAMDSPPCAPASARARRPSSKDCDPVKKVPIITASEAAALVREGAVLMAGGFGMTGNPVHLLHALAERGTRGLTFIGNNVGEAGLGGGRLLRNGQLKKAIGSFFTSNPEVVAAAQNKIIEVQL